MDRQRLGTWGVFLFAAAAAVGILFQLFFIGAYIFGETDALDVHKDLGKLVHLFYVLTFVVAMGTTVYTLWMAWRCVKHLKG